MFSITLTNQWLAEIALFNDYENREITIDPYKHTVTFYFSNYEQLRGLISLLDEVEFYRNDV